VLGIEVTAWVGLLGSRRLIDNSLYWDLVGVSHWLLLVFMVAAMQNSAHKRAHDAGHVRSLGAYDICAAYVSDAAQCRLFCSGPAADSVHVRTCVVKLSGCFYSWFHGHTWCFSSSARQD